MGGGWGVRWVCITVACCCRLNINMTAHSVSPSTHETEQARPSSGWDGKCSRQDAARGVWAHGTAGSDAGCACMLVGGDAPAGDAGQPHVAARACTQTCVASRPQYGLVVGCIITRNHGEACIGGSDVKERRHNGGALQGGGGGGGQAIEQTRAALPGPGITHTTSIYEQQGHQQQQQQQEQLQRPAASNGYSTGATVLGPTGYQTAGWVIPPAWAPRRHRPASRPRVGGLARDGHTQLTCRRALSGRSRAHVA